MTLLELLIVMTVVSVLATTAVSSFRAIIARNRLAAAHNEMLASLYLLRSEAAKRNRVMKMCRRDGELCDCDTRSGGRWDAGWVIWEDRNNDHRVGADEAVIQVGRGWRGVQVSGNGVLADRIAYRPTGAPVGFHNGTFTFCLPGWDSRKQIVVSAAGRLRSRELPNGGIC